MSQPLPFYVFTFYKDDQFRHELETHLSALKRQGVIAASLHNSVKLLAVSTAYRSRIVFRRGGREYVSRTPQQQESDRERIVNTTSGTFGG